VGATYELSGDIVSIGRGSKNDIAIDHDELSREHCRLVRLVTDYELQDLNSTNGTYVNGQRLSGSFVLQPGAVIELGDAITLEYERAESESDVTPRHKLATTPIGASQDDKQEEPFFLVVTIGREAERIYRLKNEKVAIGRDLSNDIVVQDPEVSRWHLQLQRSDEGYTASDMGSTNGTMLNGIRLNEPNLLMVNDTLILGTSVLLRYVREIGDAQQADEAGPSGQPTEKKAKKDPITSPIPAPETRRTAEFTVEYNSENMDTREGSRRDVLNIAGKRKTSQLGTGLLEGALVNHILIAYSREDWEDIVAPLTVVMQDAGIAVWVDQYLTQGGDDWTAAIEQALQECWLLVLVLAPGALESRYVKLEYRYFINREKPLIPFLYKPVEKLPQELNGLEVVRYDPENSKRSFQRLILEILHKRP
jgi:pSer/pThr/pTyr-binding forkhead associated (FHA) protein